MRFALMALCVGMMIAGGSSAGTFFNPVGDPRIEERGAEAAAQLNEALSTVHLLYAALERNKRGDLDRLKEKAYGELKNALFNFDYVERTAPNTPIKITPRSKNEEDLLRHFAETLPNYKLTMPTTQKELASVAVKVVSAYMDTFLKTPLKDSRSAEPLIRAGITLQEIGLFASLVWVIGR